jgi:hypothetical protein
VVIGDATSPGAHRDILLELRQAGGLKRIYDTHPAYQTLVYILLFPYGEHGWHPGIPLQLDDGNAIQHRQNRNADNEDLENVNEETTETGKRKNASMLEYYTFRLHSRPLRIESQHLFST